MVVLALTLHQGYNGLELGMKDHMKLKVIILVSFTVAYGYYLHTMQGIVQAKLDALTNTYAQAVANSADMANGADLSTNLDQYTSGR